MGSVQSEVWNSQSMSVSRMGSWSKVNAYSTTGPDRQAPSLERKEKTMDSTFSYNYTTIQSSVPCML